MDSLTILAISTVEMSVNFYSVKLLKIGFFKGLGEFFKNSFFSIIRVPKSIYNCQISLLAPADLSGCPRHMCPETFPAPRHEGLGVLCGVDRRHDEFAPGRAS